MPEQEHAEENLLIVEEEQVGTSNGYPLMEGVRYGRSPITENWYKMTRWEDRGDGNVRAISKQEVDQNEVEEAISR